MSFTLDTFKFLDELTLNNERGWFEKNKPRYEALVREPALDFIRSMAKPLARFAPHFVASDKKSGGSLMRVYRDTRFSKDKTPYKTNVGIQFRHAGGKDVHAPGFYIHISPKESFVGLGMWKPEPAILKGVREKIAAEHQRWMKLCKQPKLARADLAMGDGDKLKRVPKGFDKEHPAAEELKRRSFILHGPLDARDVTAKDFAARVSKRFTAGKDLMRFLCEAAGVEF